MNYDVIIIGAGPGGIFAAYELNKCAPQLKVAVFESGNTLEKRKCPIDGDKIKSCISCKNCSIMSGFGGAGAFSDGKYNITNDFGGTLYEYIGKNKALELMHYVDEINLQHGGKGTKLYRHISFQMFSLVFSKIPNGFLLVFLNSAAACGRYDLSNSKPWAQEPLPRLVGGLTMTVETPFCRRMEAAFCAWVSE